ncbi:hypothetical protein [Xylella taiwanensis]|uniref:hypothetical protein n=1 Tax=Xylella taiwanensis TaxID=1444770 RepID=UPI001F241DB5|nr:hypothetical protein [Xylella taiwanensis]
MMSANRLIGGDYVELYAGGAGVAMTLLRLDDARHIHINDLHASVHAFWWVVLHRNEDLCQRIRNTRISMREWHRQRAVQTEASPDPFDLVFSTFFLNRTNRSGIVLGGVIGGKGRREHGRWGRVSTQKILSNGLSVLEGCGGGSISTTLMGLR